MNKLIYFLQLIINSFNQIDTAIILFLDYRSVLNLFYHAHAYLQFQFNAA